MKRLWVFIATLGALLLFQVEALATHFRYGTINWVVPDPQGAPNTVKFTVQYAIVAGSPLNLQDVELFFGDGANTGPVVGTIAGTATDAGGQAYEVREFTATHTYGVAGTFTAYFQDCCRINGLVNGAGLDYRVDTKVVLQSGNTSGPVSASPPVIQMQVGGTRTFTWPVLDPDGDPVTCRFGTQPEVGFANPTPVVPDPPGAGTGGQTPTLSNVPNGCQLTWDLIDAQVGQQYVAHVIFESTHNGQISSTALDLIIEMVLPPPPTCSGGGVFITEVGMPLTAMLTGTNNVAANLTVSTVNAPAGSTLLPGGSGPSPFMNTFSWTPAMADIGTTVVLVTYTNAQNLSGTCFLTVQVPQCSNYGQPCTVGTGECQTTGTNVCAGIGQTVCSAVAGEPSAELCDGLDNDCDGTNDNGNPEAGFSCDTGEPGACAGGLTSCNGGAIECVPFVMPGSQMESCNNQDDDCDGSTDEDFNLGSACTSGVGECAVEGVMVCDEATDTGVCSAVADEPSTEICGDGLDQDCDGVADNGCTDSDGDGLFDDEETGAGTDPNDADSDDDGVPDGDEPDWDEDTDGDGLINALDPDSDDDGLYDGTELGLDCSGQDTDASEGHCVPDGDGGATTTDPLDADTDDGGVSDGSEDADHDGVVDNDETDPTAGNGADDGSMANDDTDGDGLTDAEETEHGTDPNDADSDDDGVIDGDEPNWADDTDGDGLINALDPDSDDDGLFDGTEMGLDCSNPATDPAAGTCTPDGDGGATTTSPLDPDTDDGGVTDGSEDLDHDGVIDPGETDPTAGHGADDSSNTDSDGDGLTDDVEVLVGTDPNDADSDNDGVIDGQEPNYNQDTDGDGTINALDPDSDGDGLFDGTEMGLDCSNPATDPAAETCIPDGDGGATTTSPLDPDTDDGGVSDGVEDSDHDGVLDPGETDPTDGHGDDDDQNCFEDSDCGDAQSGMVCDTATNDCVEGCHPTGNGCPTDEVCTSSDETIGECVGCITDTDCDEGQSCDLGTNTCVDDEVGCTDDAECGGPGSGQVCDTSAQQCIEGCREGGNQCAQGEQCTVLQAQSIGTCEPIGEAVVPQGGCACTVAPGTPANDNGAAWLLSLAVAGLLAARRRRS